MTRESPQAPIRPRAHILHIEDRSRMSVTGVQDVESFNDTEVVLSTEGGELVIAGEGLSIGRLNLEDGQLTVAGRIDSLEYSAARTEARGLFSRMFRS